MIYTQLALAATTTGMNTIAYSVFRRSFVIEHFRLFSVILLLWKSCYEHSSFLVIYTYNLIYAGGCWDEEGGAGSRELTAQWWRGTGKWTMTVNKSLDEMWYVFSEGWERASQAGERREHSVGGVADEMNPGCLWEEGLSIFVMCFTIVVPVPRAAPVTHMSSVFSWKVKSSACPPAGAMRLAGTPVCHGWPWVRIPAKSWFGSRCFVWPHPDLSFLTHGTGSPWLWGSDSEQWSLPPPVSSERPCREFRSLAGRKWCHVLRSWTLSTSVEGWEVSAGSECQLLQKGWRSRHVPQLRIYISGSVFHGAETNADESGKKGNSKGHS